MDFSEYQRESRVTALYPNVGSNFVYPTLGLAGETGEVVEKVKKLIRDDASEVSVEKKAEIEKELGDVLWYIAQLSTELGLDLNQIASKNLEKLKARMAAGRIHGSGDNR